VLAICRRHGRHLLARDPAPRCPRLLPAPKRRRREVLALAQLTIQPGFLQGFFEATKQRCRSARRDSGGPLRPQDRSSRAGGREDLAVLLAQPTQLLVDSLRLGSGHEFVPLVVLAFVFGERLRARLDVLTLRSSGSAISAASYSARAFAIASTFAACSASKSVLSR
jgi:hypothetical protein